MTDPALCLSFDVHPVGPRRDETAESLWLAVKLGSALSADLPKDQQEAALPRLLPWEILAGSSGFELVELRTGADSIDETIDENAAHAEEFHKELEKVFGANVRKLIEAAALSLAWSRTATVQPGEHVEEGDEDSEKNSGQTLARPWFGITSSLAALPPSISEPLRARTMIEITGDPLKKLREQAASRTIEPLILVPRQVRDESKTLTFAGWELIDGKLDAPVKLTYTDDTGAAADLLAYAMPLPAAYLLPDGNPPIGSYWLRVQDSRAQSLAEVDVLIRKHADPSVFAALLSTDLLGDTLIRVADPSNRPTADEVAAYRRELENWTAALNGADRSRFVEDIYLMTIGGISEAGNVDIAGTLGSAVAEWMEGLPARQTEQSPLKDFVVGNLFADRLLPFLAPIFRVDAPPTAVLPGEGIDFVVGDESQRIVGPKIVAATVRDRRNEMAEFGLLVRRTSSKTSGDGPWRIVTAGVPVLDPGHLLLREPWGTENTVNSLKSLKQILPRGIAVAFIDDLLRNDDSYLGQLMVGQPALSLVHGENDRNLAQDDANGALNAISFASGAPFPGNEIGLAPPLRYGDTYDLAAFLIDRGGGLPKEIADGGMPWLLDPAKFASIPEAAPASIEFKRRVPLGELNLQAWAEKDGARRRADWPAIDRSVSLRATEWLAAKGDEAGSVPAVLLSDGLTAKLPESLTFMVEPPRIDEFTLQRWCMPATDASSDAARAQVAELKDELGRIFLKRAEHLAAPAGAEEEFPDFLPHDPGVWGVAYTIRRFGPDGKELAGDPAETRQALPFRRKDNEKFLREPLVFSATSANHPTLPPDAIQLKPLAKGHFAAIAIDLLVPEQDGNRYDRGVLSYPADPEEFDIGGAKQLFYRHDGVTILAETLTDALPDADQLYSALRLYPDEAGRIVARFDAAAVDNLQFLDSFELERQRWVWRNLPNVNLSGTPDQKERELSSGLPLDLALGNPEHRDSSEPVLTFDARASLDTAFVQRSLARARWPRAADGRICAPATLFIDDRDGQTAADYLRYSLTAISRYAAYLTKAEVRAEPKQTVPPDAYADVRGPWRRVAARYRGGDRLRPANILAVLPLTSAPLLEPGTLDPATPKLEDATPFLVLLDEVWFREYGPGEALRAEIALEDREIGDTDDEGAELPRPFRLGPLPHKHVADSGHKDRKLTDEQAEKDATHRLTCFGPFGFTLDRSGNEALANATAFVLYVPNAVFKVGPHWSVGVRFRRVLHGVASASEAADSGKPIESVVGPPSGTHLLYTLADSRRLAAIQPDGSAFIRRENGTSRLVGYKVDFDLHPYRRGGSEPDVRIQRQYRYLLLIGSAGWDGGRGVEIFLPSTAAWIAPNLTLTAMGGKPTIDLPAADQLRGQILEIELSGAFPSDIHGGGEKSPIEQAKSLTELFKAHLLPRQEDASNDSKIRLPHQEDAGGRVGRVSDVFRLTPDPAGP